MLQCVKLKKFNLESLVSLFKLFFYIKINVYLLIKNNTQMLASLSFLLFLREFFLILPRITILFFFLDFQAKAY